jgi:aryl-alcohol dehydrogenase-like predicted oxidoreductase
MTMSTRAYGDSGLQVSAVAYGAMTLAHDKEIQHGVAPSLLRALEGGVTLIDTARAYPGSEELIASTLRAWQGPRPLISTKLMPSSRETFRFHRPLAEAYTAQTIRASVEASLRTLQVDRLDIVHLHQWHYLWTHEREWFDALNELRAAGKIRCIAISAQDHEHDALLEVISQQLIDGVQIIFNLFESRPMSALLPLARQRGVGVIARCVFDSGGLSNGFSLEDFANRPFLKHAPYGQYRERLEELQRRFIPLMASSVPELALRFALSVPGVSTVTIGMPDTALVDSTLAAAALGPLPAAAVESIRREHVWTRNFYERLL